ncbi:MAG: hypothetical protein Q8L22_22220, partial [Reyranella sp.]|nr:hypothetical protein [Reyranella sp.]
MTMPTEADKSAETIVRECLHEERIARLEGRPEERTIRASFLRELVVSQLTNDAADAPMFIGIENAIIEGKLQFAGIGSTTAPLPPLALTKCEIPAGIELSDSAWTSVKLDGSQIASLAASGLRVERSLLLNDVIFDSAEAVSIDLRDLVVGANLEARNLGRRGRARCSVRLDQAHIGGSMSMLGAVLSAGDGKCPALAMTGVTVKADVLLSSSGATRFETKGAVRIVNAVIGGRVSFSAASVDNAGDECLVMDGTEIGGDLLLDEHDGRRFEANGAVCLRGTTIKNSLDFMGAKLFGCPDALLLSGAQIGANLILRKSKLNRFEASGAVGLTRATIGGEVRMQGARLSGEGERFALYMDETIVHGSAYLSSDGCDRFEARGLVDLYGARFDMNLVLNGASVGGH